MESKHEKENVQQSSTWTITLIDSETQTCDSLQRRWNSDLSLDHDGKTNVKHYPVQTPIIHAAPQNRSGSKPSKFTNKFDVECSQAPKRPADNMLLSDLGLTSQAPEFSQSEFNLSSEDHWQKENPKTGGRVRFLSHDDRQSCLNHSNGAHLDEQDLGLPLRNDSLFHSHSGSWMTLTQSERDFSEFDSNLSLNNSGGVVDGKPFTSTPCKSRSKLKQSVSFHDLFPSITTQSLPNILKLSKYSSGEVFDGTVGSTCRNNQQPLSQTRNSSRNQRHSLINAEQIYQSATANRRSSLTGDIENGPYVPSVISSLFLGGRVKALHGGQVVVTGIVWYRGKLPGITDDVVGIEIDQVGLGSDGTFQGHRYFRCSPGRGLFVPFRKIIMAWPPSDH